MSLLRACSGALALALQGGVELAQADLFTVTLADGVTVYRWASWNEDLVVGGQRFVSSKPWLTRGKRSLVNTMTIPSLEIRNAASNDAYAAGANLKAQVHAGLFDGASVLLQRVFMPPPGGDTTTFGTIDLFKGLSGAAQILGNLITLTVKGKNNVLDRPAPRNTYQPSCLHTFCDSGCTLDPATHTTTGFVIGSSPTPTATFLPWTSVPTLPYLYNLGTVHITSGASAGQRRSVVGSDATGLTLSYPLSVAPLPGDTFDSLQGCDKTLGSPQIYWVGGTHPATTTFVPWSIVGEFSGGADLVLPPSVDPAQYNGGTLKMITGAAAGSSAAILTGDVTGLHLATALSAVPSQEDTFTAMVKLTSGNCSIYANTLNFRGFPFIPAPSNTARGSF